MRNAESQALLWSCVTLASLSRSEEGEGLHHFLGWRLHRGGAAGQSLRKEQLTRPNACLRNWIHLEGTGRLRGL